MAQDPESRPISVSELLARKKREDDAAAPPASPAPAAPATGQFSTGRRHVGREASVPAADLTAESSATPRATAPRASDPMIVRAPSTSFPRSSSPSPTSGSAAGRTASGMPGLSTRRPEPQPPAREEVTGIIPPVEVAEPEPVREPAPSAVTAAEEDLDFEAYRNFEDYGADEPAPKRERPKKQRRGLFGRKKQAKVEAEPLRYVDDDLDRDDLDRDDRGRDDLDRDDNRYAYTASVRPSVEPEPEYDPEPEPTRDRPDSGPLITPHVVSRTASVTRPPAPEPSPEDTQQINVVRSAPVDEVAADPVVEAPAPAVTPTRRSLREAISDGNDIPDEQPLAAKHSPAMQWVLLIGQSIAGLVVGAGIFWGFTELWRWNVIFALVLSAVVIFGIVTLVHVVRRRHDLVSVLLALGVGLVVTIGPMVLLASSSL